MSKFIVCEHGEVIRVAAERNKNSKEDWFNSLSTDEKLLEIFRQNERIIRCISG